ncbi:monocarboxylate transporter 13 [Anastrepha ludens]|uniref:monocarboxylate transporter 13 n=1 Tax=Anastrepha ludens TaxID=28586 RepID=UPI0023B12986|nr:monocarboxylate transporter 13 [Anastrepha ludens]XP_053964795.1 monocarboxylate transporter 13 [Anastrepha ludens]XP_053964796.1 monocarboxylate transporter 13 [Anastrepha ludens]XP_053964797.1 monocarboxylate transporter 13 [Anastrepha ludens]XP_053964798.1 monocarboxylate transporter 13 [Anastrepha ludens]XP_053964799.1 monocarboxylate transporter 13 [Anastrepha ludens]XP_053964801.1 monocarboxylate transporter 13 [Anastrepha ludens]XP_053964802.1 monocarboxylate transporter 13 [Anastr
MDAPQPSVSVPDGGWGWLIVGAVALINMTNQYIHSVFGLLFGAKLQSMQEYTYTAALILNLSSLTLNFSGLFIGPAIKAFKPRSVAAIGILLVSNGLFLCSFASESWHFIVGYSLFVGLGLGLITPSTFMAINSYFSAKRGRAVGLALAGSGIGQVTVPHLVRLLLDNYGFQITVLAMALFSLIGLMGAALLKPLAPPIRHNNRQHVRLLLSTDDEKNKTIPPQCEVHIVESNELVKNGDPHAQLAPQRDTSYCSKVGQRLVQAMDLELLKDVTFWSIIVGMGLVYTSTIQFTMLFPHFLQYSVGLTSFNTATCMSAVAGADIVCRLLLPCITDKLNVPYRVVFLLGTVGLLISRAALAESMDMTTIIVMSIFTGMTKSATVLNNNLTISSHCRPEKLPGGLGLNMIAKGVLVITVGQLLGWIRDYTHSYILCLHAQNILLLLVVLIWVPELFCRYKKERKVKREAAVEREEYNKMSTC